MAIDHVGYNFESPLHQTVRHGAFEFPITVTKFFGVWGEQHLSGKPSGRELTLDITLEKSDADDMDAAISAIAEKVGQFGDLDVGTGTFQNCTFLGFNPSESPWQDGSGVHGFICRGTLAWRQIASAPSP